jgi:mediator of RNA polymerase II transcription subunit 7
LGNVNQYAVLLDQSDVPNWPLSQFEKPRVDWILEDGQYNIFGDTWLVCPSSLAIVYEVYEIFIARR